MGEELLPCPRCAQHAFVHFSDPGYQVWCSTDRCLKLPPRATEAEAIAAWNRRTPPAPEGELDVDAICDEAVRLAKEAQDVPALWQAAYHACMATRAALRKPAEPVGDEVERVARAICKARGGNPDQCMHGYSWVAGEMGKAEAGSVCHRRRWEDFAPDARAAIAALSNREAIGWQPIETADLSDLFANSTIVLLFRDDGLVSTGKALFLDGGTFVWACAYGENCADPRHPNKYLRVTATHWQPLPEPPAIRNLGDPDIIQSEEGKDG